MEINLTPFGRDTTLTGYDPLPRQLLTMGLSSTAILLYAVLLGRGTLSQKNGRADQRGRVYVVYPVEKLAETLGKGTTVTKDCLRELEKAGLIQRKRTVKNGPSYIFLNLPTDGKPPVRQSENRPEQGRKTVYPMGGKPSPNYKRNKININDYYQQEDEEESL